MRTHQGYVRAAIPRLTLMARTHQPWALSILIFGRRSNRRCDKAPQKRRNRGTVEGHRCAEIEWPSDRRGRRRNLSRPSHILLHMLTAAIGTSRRGYLSAFCFLLPEP